MNGPSHYRATEISSKEAIGIGLYAVISTILFCFLKEKGFTLLLFRAIPLAIVTGILIWMNIVLSEKLCERARGDHSYCPISWGTTFVIGVTMGFITCLVAEATTWNIYVGLTIWAGIYAFSHVTVHDKDLTVGQLKKVKKLKDVKDPRMFCEWVRLEHDGIRLATQVILSLFGLILTGGILTYFIQQKSFWGPGMQDTIVVTIWAAMGIWFGILGPLHKRMNLLKDKLRKLSTEQT